MAMQVDPVTPPTIFSADMAPILAAGAEATGGALGWNPGLYRLWYATGAIGVAAYLGAGTLFLHRDPPFGAPEVDEWIPAFAGMMNY